MPKDLDQIAALIAGSAVDPSRSQSTIDAGRDLEPADEQRGTAVLEAGQHDFEKQCRCVARVEDVAHACEFPGERLIEPPDTLGEPARLIQRLAGKRSHVEDTRSVGSRQRS